MNELDELHAAAKPLHRHKTRRPDARKGLFLALFDTFQRLQTFPNPSIRSDLPIICQSGRQSGGQEVAGSNPVAPSGLDRKPFDENIEGLFHCPYERCVF